MKTTINVDYSSEEIATEQVEAEMKQRVFGSSPTSMLSMIRAPNRSPRS